jgi:CHAT domain-containing protein/tetratricopeptide (TPR) repeat protein
VARTHAGGWVGIAAAILFLTRILAVAGQAPNPQGAGAKPAAPDPALLQQLGAASTAEAREALLAAHPDLGTPDVRRALLQALDARAPQGDITPVLNTLHTLLLAAERADDARGRTVILTRIGSVTGRAGLYAPAEAALAEALAMAGRLNDVENVIIASNNLGIVQREQGRYDEATASYRQAIAAAERIGRRETIARGLNNLAVVAQLQGDLRTSADLLTRSFAMKEALGMKAELANTALNLGVVHHLQRNFELARDYYERALAIGEQTGNRRSIATGLTNLGNLLMEEGRPADAEVVLRRALAETEAQGDQTRQATALNNLGSIAAARGQWTEAETLLARSLALNEASGDQAGLTDALITLAGTYLLQRKLEPALEASVRAADVAKRIGLANSLWRALTSLGAANEALDRIEAARRAYRESIDVVEHIRSRSAGGPDDLQRFFRDKSEPYHRLAALEAASGRAADAFAASEAARARVLLDVLDGGRPIVSGLSTDERARERALDREVVSLTAQLAAARAHPDRARALDEQLTRARRAKDAWRFEAYAAHPDLQFARADAPTVPYEQVAAALPPRTAVAMFMVGLETTRMLLLTRGARGPAQLRLISIGADGADLERRVRGFAGQLSRRDLAFAKDARGLYDLLLGAADRDLAGVTTLLVVPDGPLWELPFQALITPRGPFLIEERSISVTHSMSAWHALQARKRARSGRPPRFVGFGDPTASADGSGVLPTAVGSVRALAAAYGSTSRVFVGPDATERRLREAAPSATVLHVATHGEFAARSPMYSFVALAPEPGGSGPDVDGRAEAWEVANMVLHADLAVLSACETARGDAIGGEGVIGLSWSLLAAGASTAAVSLWRVDAASTTDLMLTFHRDLRQPGAGDRSPAAAMRAAARALIASGRYRHPFYWAAFVVVGAS